MAKVYNRKHRGESPAGAVYVGRPTFWGNPYIVGKDGTREEVVAKYRQLFDGNPRLQGMARQELRGKDLVCWCAPAPCHGDILLEIANGEEA